MKISLRRELVMALTITIISIIFSLYTGLVYYKAVPKENNPSKYQTKTFYYARNAGENINISKTEFYSSELNIVIFNVSADIFYVIINNKKMFVFDRQSFIDEFNVDKLNHSSLNQLTILGLKFIKLSKTFPGIILDIKRIGNNLTINKVNLKNEACNLERFISRVYTCSTYDK